MNKILNLFPSYRDSVENDYIGRQRFIFFFYFSAIAICSSIFFSFQAVILYKVTGITLYLLTFLCLSTFLNLVALRKYGNTKRAYGIIIAISFLCIHVITYEAGGIFSSANYFLGVLAITTFFLLGKKAGWIYLGFATAHAILITILTLNNSITEGYQGRFHGADEWDMLTLLVLSTFVIVVNCAGFEKSKNLILESAKESNEKVKEYADSLEKINNDLDRFAYIVSHDLKAPLRAISHLSQWIEDDLEGDIKNSTKENLEMMRVRVNRMENLINGILEYSKINKTENIRENLSIKDLVSDVIFMLDPPGNMVVEIKGNMPNMTADKTKLAQVFSNLISNAIKYNDKPNGLIEVSSLEKETEYEFTVADNGPGIAKEYHEKIFIIFQTLQSRDTFESTGVGLAIVKKIIEENGGIIRVESEQGKGTRFIFTLPKKSYKSNPDEFRLKSVA